MLSDYDVELAIRRGFGGDEYSLSTIVISDGKYDVRFRIRGDGREFGIRLPLPSSSGIPVWLYVPPIDAQDWAGMLRIWMDEEILTGAAQWAETIDEDGVSYFAVELYGFRRADPVEHSRLVRLMAATGDGNGWTYYGGS